MKLEVVSRRARIVSRILFWALVIALIGFLAWIVLYNPFHGGPVPTFSVPPHK
jgi:hypothetical protein